jgi:hypothetical protein
MTTTTTAAVNVFTAGILLCLWPGAVLAAPPEPPNATWRKVEQSLSRIDKANVVWQRTTTLAPDPNHLALTPGSLRREGMSDADANRVSQVQEQIAELDRDAYTQSATLSFVRSGNRLLCNVDSQSVAGQSSSQTYHMINYCDGKYVVETLGPWLADLQRSNNNRLPNAANGFGEVMLFTGSPPASDFPAPTTRITVGPGHVVTLTRQITRPFACIMQLHISTDSWEPTEMDALRLGGGPPLMRYRMSGYRQFRGGISFPSSIAVQMISKSGICAYTESYRLVQASFNRYAGTNLLDHPLPWGMVIEDYRFKHGVTYRLTSAGIPSDADVQAMARRSRLSERFTRFLESLRSPRVLGPFLTIPLAVIGVGVVLRVRSRPRRRSR